MWQLRICSRAHRGDYSVVFCANDVMAMAAISRLGRLGIGVPGQMSVLGFDNGELSRYTAPTWSTVGIPIVDAAANACRSLLNRCYGMALPVTRDFAPEIVWLDSLGVGPLGLPQAVPAPGAYGRW
jgi:LacI family transcriptional regulator